LRYIARRTQGNLCTARIIETSEVGDACSRLRRRGSVCPFVRPYSRFFISSSSPATTSIL